MVFGEAETGEIDYRLYSQDANPSPSPFPFPPMRCDRETASVISHPLVRDFRFTILVDQIMTSAQGLSI